VAVQKVLNTGYRARRCHSSAMLFGACNQLSTSAAEAHKMTVTTLEDHSSKGWSHH
jgi:hypothetical protein